MKLYLRLDKDRLFSPFLIMASIAVLLCCNDQRVKTNRNTASGPVQNRTLKFEQKLSFVSADNRDTLSTIQVALADDPKERSTGLMDISRLPPDKGMLFIFDKEEPRSFWMANTPLTLDIIFVNSDSTIVRIHRSTAPFAETNYHSGEPAKYVVEVNGGFCVDNDIVEGDKIRF